MGNDQSGNVSTQALMENLRFVRKVRDERFGEITLMEDMNTNRLVGLKERNLNNAEEFRREAEELAAKKAANAHPNILRLLGFTSASQDSFCAKFHRITALFEIVENDLEQELEMRRERRLPFSEEELWNVFGSVVSALSFLQSQGIAHGDIRPSAVFVTPEGGFKVCNQSLLNSGYSNYVFMMIGSHGCIPYLSPSLLAALKRREPRPVHNPHKSDVFSLGMTLLNAGLLSSSDTIYDWGRFMLDERALNDRLAHFTANYSDILTGLLRGMLDTNEDRRPDFLALERYLHSGVHDLVRKHPTSAQLQNSHPAASHQISHPPANHQIIHPPVNQQMSTPTSYAIQQSHSPYRRHKEPSQSLQSVPSVNSLQMVGGPRYHQEESARVVNSVDCRNFSEVQTPGSMFRNEHQQQRRPTATPVYLQRQDAQTPVSSNTRTLIHSHSQNVIVGQPSHFEQPTTLPQILRAPPSPYQQHGPGAQISHPQLPHLQVSHPQASHPQFSNPQVSHPQVPHHQPQISHPQVSHPQASHAQVSHPQVSQPQVRPNPPSIQKLQQAPTAQLTQPQTPVQALKPAAVTPTAQVTEKTLSAAANSVQTELINNEEFKKVTMPDGSVKYYKKVLLPATQNNANAQGQAAAASSQQTIQTQQAQKTPAALQTPNHDTSHSKCVQLSPFANQGSISFPKQNGNQLEVPRKSVNLPREMVNPLASVDINSERGVGGNDIYDGRYTSGKGLVPEAKDYSTNHQQTAQAQQQRMHVTVGANGSYQLISTANEANRQNQEQRVSYNQPLDPRLIDNKNDSSTTRTSHYKPTLTQTTSVSQGQSDISNKDTQSPYDNSQNAPYFAQQATSIQLLAKGNTTAVAPLTPSRQPFINPLAPSANGLATFVSGEMKANAQEGMAVTDTYPDGSVYIGTKLNGLRHGRGKFCYAEGGMYEGEWRHDSMEGQGKLFYVSGKLAYEGEWRDDKFWGKGVVYNDLPAGLPSSFRFENFDLIGDYWLKYEGDFVEDNKEGLGSFFLTNNERYYGEFKNDLVNGRGNFYKLDGTIVAGEWQNNHLICIFKPM